MSRLRTMIVIGMLLCAVVSAAWGQDALSAKLQPTGMVTVSRGEVELATIELNAHGPEWKHASQALASGEVTDLPDGAGGQVVGTLPIPNTDEGALRFTETVKAIPQGLRLDYDVAVTKAMKINGLQVSILLPVGQYGGKEIVITHPEAEVRSATLPAEPAGDNTQVWGGEGARIEVGKGTDEAITIEARAATDLVVQDLRKWERQVFEIRFPAIMEDQGRELTPDDKFHLDLILTFAAAVKLDH